MMRLNRKTGGMRKMTKTCSICGTTYYEVECPICKPYKDLVRKVDVNLQIVDISKFQNDINWKPEISFEQSMKDLLNYWRKDVLEGQRKNV